MKFDLVHAPERADRPPGGSATGGDAPGATPRAHDELSARMHERGGELRTRLTSIIEAVRPALRRMEEGIVRSERALADSGHDRTAEPPANFREFVPGG